MRNTLSSIGTSVSLSKLKTFAFMVLLLAFIVSIPTILTKAAPPQDFQTNLIASGLEGPSGFEIAPDGRIFVLERAGKVKIIKNGQLLPQSFVEFNSVASGDRGLIGIDFDPDFGVSNFWVYFYYTGQDLVNHVVRYDASTDVGTQGPFEIFATQSPSQQLHVGGTIQFGPDGKLYFAVGDNGYPPNAQDVSNPHGKILRINKDGTIPSDNPFYGQPDKLGAIWAYGMRNPWRFQFDDLTGQLISADVGDYTWEEVNRVTKGGNYGWPLKEGYCTQDCEGLIDPIYAYDHNGASAAVTGGPIYRGSMFPSEYTGSYFFGDYAQGFIKRATFNPDGSVDQILDFDNAAGSVVDMKIAPDGSMYYITYYPGRVYQITHNADNPAPTAVASADNTQGAQAPFTVSFTGDQSSDPGDDPLSYLWDFGDGNTSTLENPTHTYTTEGAFTVDLTVSDGENFANATPIVIQIGQPPVITIATPADASTYHSGDTITYNLFATDAAGFDLNDADISTDIVFHHDTHTHPFIENQIGRVGSFTIPDTGEASANTWYRIVVTATAGSGVSATKDIDIYPEVVQMTYTTQPAGLTVDLDGVPHTSPHSVPQVIGFKRELSAPATQIDQNGATYAFKEWSDGGAIRHFVTAGSVGETITAVYEPATEFTGEYYDNMDLLGTPVLTRDDPVIHFAWGLGSPAPGIPTDNFSVRWTRTQDFAEGRYTFTTATDDGVRLYIDGRLVIDKWQDQGGTAWSYTEYLLAGPHEIRMEYYDNVFDAAAKLDWEATPDQTPPAITGWRGEYYANQTLSGAPVLIRGDETIDFDWGLGSPDPLVPADNFSVEWTKTEVFETGTYRFTLTSDDGIRMYIDDELVLYEWDDHAPTTFTVDRAMTAGPHDIRIEYYENGYGAVAQYGSEKITGDPPSDAYVAEYFDTMTLTGQPVVTQNEPAINHDWGQAVPVAGVPADNFSARWTGTKLFDTGVYKFSVTADDGVRLYVDDQLIIDKWIDQGATTYTYNLQLAAGYHDIRMEYYENQYDAVAIMNYAPTTEDPDQLGNPWHMHFYGNKTLSGPVIVDEHVYAQALDFDWGLGAPFPGVPVDDFSAEFEKTATFTTAGVYKFTMSNDDGVRLYFDDVLYYDTWEDQSATIEHTVNIPVTAGDHDIKLEYYEHGFDAIVQLAYDTTTEPADDPVPSGSDWTAEYFGNMTLSGQPLVSRVEPAIAYNWGAAAPVSGVPDDGFSVRWTQTVSFTAGTYVLTATSDDGIRVYIDGVLTLNEWNDHGVTTFTETVALAAGDHTIVVEYYDNTHDAVAEFSIQPQ